MTKFVELTWSEFEEQFKPIKNHLVSDPDQLMFETYGEEDAFVISKIAERKVWSYADGDYCSYVSNGYHYVNRIGYYVCELPYEENVEYQIIVSTEEECVCYKEDGYEDGEFGDANCPECEGYGRITRYAD
jgi:hypothetical protein